VHSSLTRQGALRAPGVLFALLLAIVPAKRAAEVLLSAEGITVALIVVVAVVVLIKMLAGTAPGDAEFTMKVFSVPSGTPTSDLFLGIIFGLLSFAGFEAASTLGEETNDPQRDIPRAILGTAIFGGIYFTVVTAIEMMAFGTDDKGVADFIASPALMGDLGTSYIGAWVGHLITLGACISAFACCLACVVGASRLLFAITRDLAPGHPLGRTGTNATPARAAVVVCSTVFLIGLICAVFLGAEPFDTFLWSGTIGTLILLVAYVLATIGCIKLLFVDRRMAVPMWEVVIPLAALVMLGYTMWRNVIPYPEDNPARWFPVVAFGWVLLVAVVMIASEKMVKELGLKPRARIVDQVIVGSEPVIMLTGPVPATEKILKRTGMTMKDIDLVEINEAFAPVILAWAKEHNPDLDRVNVNGGAIALGHPIGASGARVLTTLLYALRRHGGRYGVASLCIGGGMGTAMVVERIA